jgi:hypothetical protein
MLPTEVDLVQTLLCGTGCPFDGLLSLFQHELKPFLVYNHQNAQNTLAWLQNKKDVWIRHATLRLYVPGICDFISSKWELHDWKWNLRLHLDDWRWDSRLHKFTKKKWTLEFDKDIKHWRFNNMRGIPWFYLEILEWDETPWPP